MKNMKPKKIIYKKLDGIFINFIEKTDKFIENSTSNFIKNNNESPSKQENANTEIENLVRIQNSEIKPKDFIRNSLLAELKTKFNSKKT